jgi:TonB family protein
MNDLFNFQIQAGINLALMYSFYWLFMRNDNMHKTARFYLLASLFLPFIIPSIDFKAAVSSSASYQYLLEEISIVPLQIAETSSDNYSMIQVILIIYLIIAGLLFSRFLYQFALIGWMILKFGTTKVDGLKIVMTNRKNAAFSFFNYVFLGFDNNGKDQIDKILLHEWVHSRQYHSIDLILLELFTIIQWFNPAVWMLKHSFRNVHEYLADEGVLGSGVNKSDYQKMLMYQTFGINYNFLTNSFNHSLIKRRFIMMSKVQKNKMSAVKVMLVLPVAIFMTMVLSISFSPQILAQETKKTEETKSEIKVVEKNSQKEEVFTLVEQMPEYPGGEDARIKFMVENIKYPEDARKSGVQGIVFVSFVVEKDGKITNVKTLRGINNSCDKEAERVISMMPAWKPGIQRGQPVRVQFNMPVKFSLSNNKEKPSQENPENK